MRVILVGHKGSDRIAEASLYLAHKYMPGFDIERLDRGEQPVDKWSLSVGNRIRDLPDEFVILALDDYLLSEPIDMGAYESAMDQFKDPDVACVKIHESTSEEHLEYPVTTQYTIWRREFLLDLLDRMGSPWDFETRGSSVFKSMGKICAQVPALRYDTSSALSPSWKGIHLGGLSIGDRTIVKRLIHE